MELTAKVKMKMKMKLDETGIIPGTESIGTLLSRLRYTSVYSTARCAGKKERKKYRLQQEKVVLETLPHCMVFSSS